MGSGVDCQFSSIVLGVAILDQPGDSASEALKINSGDGDNQLALSEITKDMPCRHSYI